MSGIASSSIMMKISSIFHISKMFAFHAIKLVHKLKISFFVAHINCQKSFQRKTFHSILIAGMTLRRDFTRDVIKDEEKLFLAGKMIKIQKFNTPFSPQRSLLKFQEFSSSLAI
jgi:hypothetical protein